jgi:hypothetical protein
MDPYHRVKQTRVRLEEGARRTKNVIGLHGRKFQIFKTLDGIEKKASPLTYLHRRGLTDRPLLNIQTQIFSRDGRYGSSTAATAQPP